MENVNMKTKILFLVSLIALAIIGVLTPSESIFADDKIEATFDYNVERIAKFLPIDVTKNITNQKVEVQGLYAEDPNTLSPSIFYYYDYEWSVNGQVVQLDNYLMLEDTTFEAVWTPKEYTIYYKYITNDELEEIDNLMLSETYSVEHPVVFYRPSRPHYAFLDWYSSPQFKSNEICIYTPDYAIGDKVIYARFQPIEYYITYHTDAKNTDNPKSYNVESPTYELEAPVKDGHIFKGWYLDENCTYEYTTIEKGSYGNLDLYPLWELEEFQVKYVMPDGKTQIVKTKYGQTADAPQNYNTMFQLVVYEGNRNNVTSDIEINVKYINIWYIYVIGLLIIIGIVVAIVLGVIRKRKQLHKLRYIYQSNFKRK